MNQKATDGRDVALHDVVGHLPTEFRGCQWNDGWEFDAPCVVYYPRKYLRYGYGGNTGAIHDLVEDICMDIAAGNEMHDGGLADEIAWRGWGKRFERRREAWHVVYRVRWFLDNGGLAWEITEQVETYGLPNPKLSGPGPDEKT